MQAIVCVESKGDVSLGFLMSLLLIPWVNSGAVAASPCKLGKSREGTKRVGVARCRPTFFEATSSARPTSHPGFPPTERHDELATIKRRPAGFPCANQIFQCAPSSAVSSQAARHPQYWTFKRTIYISQFRVKACTRATVEYRS